MDYFAQQLINGLVLGSIYGLIAIGYTMVYGIVGMINFAHGDIFMIGGFIALITFLILVSFGLTAIPLILLIVLLVSMAITALYGWTVERIAYRPLRHSFRLAPMLSAIGMSFVLINYSQISQGARVKPIPPIITGGYSLHESDGFVVRLSNAQIIVVLTTIVLLAIFTAMLLFGPPIQNARDRYGITAGVIAAMAMGAQSVLVRLLMKGVPQQDTGFYEAVEAHGAVIVAEDDWFGSRAAGQDIEVTDDLLQAIFHKYYFDAPSPRVFPSATADQWFRRKASEVDGVIFYLPAEDDTLGWDYPRLRAFLDARGIPHLLARDACSAPVRAFIESLRRA